MGEKNHKKRILRKDIVSGNSCFICPDEKNRILIIDYVNKESGKIEKRIKENM